MTSLTKRLQKRRLLSAKIAELSKELAELDREIFPRIESLAAAIDGDISSRQKTTRAFTVDHAMPGADAVIERARRTTLALAVEDVLREFKRPMKTSEIFEELKRRNIEVPGKMPQNNLAAHLSHYKKLFANTSDGWQLRQGTLDETNAHAAQ